jgi:hypothetical protein
VVAKLGERGAEWELSGEGVHPSMRAGIEARVYSYLFKDRGPKCRGTFRGEWMSGDGCVLCKGREGAEKERGQDSFLYGFFRRVSLSHDPCAEQHFVLGRACQGQ